MSKQQSQSPELSEQQRKQPKKQKGKFELWMRSNPKYDEERTFGKWDWWKIRSYKTRELAEKNLADQNRKWNRLNYREPDWWQFEIRVKD